jgi:hypothetical protein
MSFRFTHAIRRRRCAVAIAPSTGLYVLLADWSVLIPHIGVVRSGREGNDVQMWRLVVGAFSMSCWTRITAPQISGAVSSSMT